MIFKKNLLLSKLTTIKIGGIAKKYYEPESINELIELVKTEPSVKKYIISGGSNILINDKKEFNMVLSMKSVNKKLEKKGQYIYCGASVKIQDLINYIVDNNYGGIEYLYSLPALVGGTIYMNAGRGKENGASISDYIYKVECLKDNKIISISKEECEFNYRKSIFQNNDYIILGCYFLFPSQEKKKGKKLILERINYSRYNQDLTRPNFGSLFCECNSTIMNFMKKIRYGKKDKVHYSGKTSNWILKEKDGNYNDVLKLIKGTQIIHRIFGKKSKVEIIIWE